MQFRKKLLFRNQDNTVTEEASVMESVWAHVITDNTGNIKKAGRFRLRVSKFTQDQMAAMGIEIAGEDGSQIFAVQGTTDLWHESEGWLPCIDWMGAPTDSLLDIEELLLEQMEAFLAGISIKAPKVVKSIQPDIPPKNKPESKPVSKPQEPVSSNTDDDEDDDDWI